MPKYRRIASVDKQRLYDAFLRKEDYVELAKQLGIKRTTAWAIIKRAEENGGEITRPRGGIRLTSVKVTDNMVETAVAITQEHPEFTLNQINGELRLRLPHSPAIGRTTLANMLSGRLISLKKLEDAPPERNSQAVKNQRFEFAEWLMRNGIQCHLVFIDEAGINLWCKRTRGRAPRGQQAVRVVNGRRGGQLTVTFAISSTRGLINHNIRDRGMTNEHFCNFLEETAQNLPVNDEQTVFIFDNAPAHRRAENASLPGNCSVRWLPPYSPFLNIVENCFSQWKSAIKRDLAATREHILQMPFAERMQTLAQLAEQHAIISAENAASYFRHLQSYLPACMTRNDILM